MNRWYSPHQASFITPDPLGLIDGPNRYSYGRNHPLMWIDPLGLAAEGPFAGFKRAAFMVGGYVWQATRTAAHDPMIAPWLGPFGWTAWFVVPAPDDSFISDATLGERMNPLNQIYAGFTAAHLPLLGPAKVWPYMPVP